MVLWGYIASFFIGLILGMLGSGGSILSIPILVYLFSFDVVTAAGYSLFLVGATSLAGAIQRLGSKTIDLRTAFSFGVPSVIAVFATRKWIVAAIPEVLIQTSSFVLTRRLLILGLFAALMIVASVLMIWKRPTPSAKGDKAKLSLLILEGAFIGFLSGLVGAGGGFLIVPSLVFLARISFKEAVGTTLVIIACNSLIGFLGDVLNYQIDWRFLLVLTGIAVSGIFVGNLCSRHIPAQHLKRSFGWFTLFMGVGILIKESFFHQ